MLSLFLQTLPSRPNTCFIAVSDFDARKKTLTLTVQFFPPHAGKGQILPSREGGEGDGVLKFRFDWRVFLLLSITIAIFSNLIGASTTLFFTNYCVGLKSYSEIGQLAITADT